MSDVGSSRVTVIIAKALFRKSRVPNKRRGKSINLYSTDTRSKRRAIENFRRRGLKECVALCEGTRVASLWLPSSFFCELVDCFYNCIALHEKRVTRATCVSKYLDVIISSKATDKGYRLESGCIRDALSLALVNCAEFLIKLLRSRHPS